MAFKCPGCKKSDSFTIRGAIETHEEITLAANGDLFESSGGDVTWEDKNEMKCDNCDFEGAVKDFEKKPKKKP